MPSMQQGVIKLSIVVPIALGIGFIASAYLNVYQNQQSNQEQTQLQGQITDLTYQVKQDHLALAGTAATPAPTSEPTPVVTPTPTATPAATPAVAGAASVSISQFGVHFSVADPVADLTYAPVESGGLIVAGFTTQGLRAQYPACTSANAALGMLVRRPKGQSTRPQDKFIKSLGGYNFYYVAPFSDCTAAAHSLIATDTAAISATALPTLSQ